MERPSEYDSIKNHSAPTNTQAVAENLCWDHSLLTVAVASVAIAALFISHLYTLLLIIGGWHLPSLVPPFPDIIQVPPGPPATPFTQSQPTSKTPWRVLTTAQLGSTSSILSICNSPRLSSPPRCQLVYSQASTHPPSQEAPILSIHLCNHSSTRGHPMHQVDPPTKLETVSPTFRDSSNQMAS